VRGGEGTGAGEELLPSRARGCGRPPGGARPRHEGRLAASERARARADARRHHAPADSAAAERRPPACPAVAARYDSPAPEAPETRRAACAFLRAAVLRWSAPRLAALSIQRTRSACSRATSSASPSDGRPQPPCQRLHRRAVAQVLEPLPCGAADTLLLLADVRHSVKTPARAAGRGDASKPPRAFALAGPLARSRSQGVPLCSRAVMPPW